MTERVRAARAAGRKIIGLSSGDPNLDTDPRIIAAAERAMRDGDTHYGPPAGLPALREAIVRRDATRSGVTYDPADVIVTPGGKFALLTALMGTVEAGDEVLVPEPGWVSYGPCVRLCGGTPVGMLDARSHRRRGARTPWYRRAPGRSSSTRRSIRPAACSREAEIASVLAFAQRHDLWILFDQVYCDLLYQGEFPYPQRLAGGQERVFVIDSLSKTFGMTGWRLGYLRMPPGPVEADPEIHPALDLLRAGLRPGRRHRAPSRSSRSWCRAIARCSTIACCARPPR